MRTSMFKKQSDLSRLVSKNVPEIQKLKLAVAGLRQDLKLLAENITGGAHKEDQQDPHRQQDSHSKSEIQNLKSSVSNIHEEMKGMSEIIKQNAVADKCQYRETISNRVGSYKFLGGTNRGRRRKTSSQAFRED